MDHCLQRRPIQTHRLDPLVTVADSEGWIVAVAAAVATLIVDAEAEEEASLTTGTASASAAAPMTAVAGAVIATLAIEENGIPWIRTASLLETSETTETRCEGTRENSFHRGLSRSRANNRS